MAAIDDAREALYVGRLGGGRCHDADAPVQSDVTVGRVGLLPRYARIVGCHIRQFNPLPTAAEGLV